VNIKGETRIDAPPTEWLPIAERKNVSETSLLGSYEKIISRLTGCPNLDIFSPDAVFVEGVVGLYYCQKHFQAPLAQKIGR